MKSSRMKRWMFAAAATLACALQAHAGTIVAEGEKFTPQGEGWKITHQDHSYASHTYGGMWVSNGAVLGADETSVGAVATQTINIPEAGHYRIWSKYQAPPYFSYAHTIEIEQGGKKVFSHTYGLTDAVKLWSFSAGEHKSIWWFWGVDHDAAEAPAQMIALQAGPATLKLITAENPKPAGERFVDFVVLTTDPESTYRGYKPYAIASPFLNEAIEANRLYARFQNTGSTPAKLDARTAGHLQPQYGGQNGTFPEADVAPGEWSPWFNIAGICRMMHDEGVWVKVPGATTVPMQFARDEQGKDIVGDLALASGEAVVIPIDIAWNKESKVRSSRDRAEEVIALTKSGKWRSSNGGKKPQKLVYYGAFNGLDYVWRLKDALRYNTLLPDGYDKVRPDGYHQHTWTADQIRAYADQVQDKAGFRVLSFGDEISLGSIDFNDPAMQTGFNAWLAKKGITKADLGVEPAQAKLTPLSKDGDQRLMWYSARFNEEMRFTDFRERTELAKQLFGPHVLTGANYSPHHLAMCYGPIFQWVDIFKHNGMNMFWAEDYIFSVPEAPQILSWMFAQTRAGVKYNNQPIHYYIMPHAPGQPAEFLRRNMVYAIGAGATQIDSFWVGPAEHYTENFVSWDYTDSFQAIYESILDSAVVEDIAVGGKQRPTRVALITGKATDFNETRLTVPSSQDPFMSRSTNAPAETQQIICRKDQQMLYLSLKHAQHNVDLITEDDIVEMGILKNYDVVYFAGEWVNHRAVPKIEQWIKDGGVFYAAAGAGHRNEFNERDDSLAKVLGLKSLSEPVKNIYVIRTLLELPQAPTIGTITLADGSSKVQAIGMKQTLVPDDAKVIGTWEDGSAAVTIRELGKGKAITVGTLAGNTYMKTAVRNVPWARGGYKNLYNPTEFDPAAIELAHLGINAREVVREAQTSSPYVEAMLIDGNPGTLLTLVNWNNSPVDELQVTVRVPFAPKSIKSVQQGKDLKFEYADGVATFTTTVTEADYVVIAR